MALHQVLVTLEIFFLGLGLTVTEINIKKLQKQDLKNVKDVGMACHKGCKQCSWGEDTSRSGRYPPVSGGRRSGGGAGRRAGSGRSSAAGRILRGAGSPLLHGIGSGR